MTFRIAIPLTWRILIPTRTTVIRITPLIRVSGGGLIRVSFGRPFTTISTIGPSLTQALSLITAGLDLVALISAVGFVALSTLAAGSAVRSVLAAGLRITLAGLVQ